MYVHIPDKIGVPIVPDKPNTPDEPLGFRKPPQNSFGINSVRNKETYLSDIFYFDLARNIKTLDKTN